MDQSHLDQSNSEPSERNPIGKQERVRTLRMKLFAVADRCVDRGVRLLKIFHEGFWLGCLNPDELNAMTVQHFDQSEMYSSNEHNRSGFFEWEKQISDRYFRRGSRVLVAGAGGGREVLALRKSGFEAEGFECSLPLVEASQKIFDEAGESNYVVHCPPDCVPAGPAAFDGLMVGWGAYTHIPTRARRIRFLQALRKRALPNAPLLISFFSRRTFSRDDLLTYRVARFCSSFSPERRSTLQIGDRISYARYVHYFGKEEVTGELKAAGFRVAHFAAEGELAYAVGFADEARADGALDLS